MDRRSMREAGDRCAEEDRMLRARREGRGVVERTLAAAEPVLDAGRATVQALMTGGEALAAGRDALATQWRRNRRPSRPYLWLGAGALGGAMALALGRKLLSLDTMAWGRRVDDVMVRDVEMLPASATIAEAARRMRDHNVGVLPIVDGDRMRALVTDRDLVVRGVATGLDPASARAVECATREPIVARPDWSVDRALSTMAEHQVGRLPVVDGDGRVVGMVTLSSLALRSYDQEEALDAARHVSLRSAKAS
jgi:CBS domain-containing protein